MIQPVSNQNANFKGFYSKAGDKFTPNQYIVAKDIKSKLGNLVKNENFMISTGAIKDSVGLWKVKGLTTGNINKNEIELQWKEADFIGTYSKEAPFKLKDLERKKDYAEGIITGICLGIITTAILIVCGTLSKSNKNTVNKIKTEQYQPFVNDSLQKLKTDSCKL